MKKVTCKDLNPNSTDDAVFTAETEEEVIDQAIDHARKEHPEDISGMSDPEMRDFVRSKITEV